MAVNKNFVVKNGLEVATNLIVADAQNLHVGLGTTAPLTTLDVRGDVRFADDESGVWKDQKDYMKGKDPMEVHQNNFLLQANRFLDGYEGKDCDLATLEEAYLNLKVVLAAKSSWKDKKIIKIS